MGYHLIPDPLKSDSEDDLAPPPIIYGREIHQQEAGKCYKSPEPLTSDRVTELREEFGWNEFVSKERHIACKVIDAVGVIYILFGQYFD